MPRKTRLEVTAVNWAGLRQRELLEAQRQQPRVKEEDDEATSNDEDEDDDVEAGSEADADTMPVPPPPALPEVVDGAAAAAEALEAARIAALAEAEERRADQVWRELHEEQRRRTQKAEAERAQRELEERKAAVLQQQEQAAARRREAAAAAAAAAAAEEQSKQPARDDDAPDETGWTPREQRALEAAMRANPPSMEKKARWEAISAAVGRPAKECVARCRAVATAVKKALPPPLLRLQHDAVLRVCELVGGRELCQLAATCKELTPLVHDDALWLPYGDALPHEYAYSVRDRGGEAVWRYTLRLREGLFGSWRMLTEHRAGSEPYLGELGKFERGRFRPTGGHLPYRIKYGAICELVQREAKVEGGLNHKTYKAVAEWIVNLSANSKSAVPPELHMTVREIYKTCYAGFGSATGSGAYQPGLQAGGSSAKGGASGSMVGKGVAVMTKKVHDEEMRKRLETYHEFLSLVR